FEHATPGLGILCSIHLSYGGSQVISMSYALCGSLSIPLASAKCVQNVSNFRGSAPIEPLGGLREVAGGDDVVPVENAARPMSGHPHGHPPDPGSEHLPHGSPAEVVHQLPLETSRLGRLAPSLLRIHYPSAAVREDPRPVREGAFVQVGLGSQNAVDC